MTMSAGDFLECCEGDLRRIALDATQNDLDEIFKTIWQQVRPLYAGQPKSSQSAHGLRLAEAALQLATYVDDHKLLIEARHMMGRSLAANEQFEAAIPYYRQVIA